MKWSAPVIAGFVLDAGFAGHQAVKAVSLALVTSGGDDTFRWHGPVPGSGDYRGLFGVDVDTYVDMRTLDLTNPRVNAAAAYVLTDRIDAFSWSPWFANGVWRWAEAVAADAVTRPDRTPALARDDVNRGTNVDQAHVLDGLDTLARRRQSSEHLRG